MRKKKKSKLAEAKVDKEERKFFTGEKKEEVRRKNGGFIRNCKIYLPEEEKK